MRPFSQLGVCLGYFQYTGLISFHLDEAQEERPLVEWIEAKRPKNSVKAHKTYINEFLQYTSGRQLDPKTPVAVASFMKHCVTDRPKLLGRTTVCCAIPAAINHHFRYANHKSPTDSVLVKETKKTIERSTGTPSTGKSPITLEMLRKITSRTLDNVESIRNTFMVLLMTLAMLRESEAVQLKATEVWEENIQSKPSIFVFIQRSKTDQAADGSTIVVSSNQDIQLCPVQWFRRFTQVRDKSATFLFFTLPLSSSTPNFIVKKLLTSIGIDPKEFGSHSCRRGGCTMAVEKGVDMRLIARHGRWKSSAILSYVKDSLDTQLSVTSNMK